MKSTARNKKRQHWRVQTKNIIVESFGGSCAICGYSKYVGALELHHLDPSEKDLSIGHLLRNRLSWKRFVVELRKCVLLCSNCHKEVHAGLSEVPPKAKRFDESFEEYPTSLEDYDPRVSKPTTSL